ncbi:hypothetical protein BDV06DRAFT_165094 [Aspergillus oleicola]
MRCPSPVRRSIPCLPWLRGLPLRQFTPNCSVIAIVRGGYNDDDLLMTPGAELWPQPPRSKPPRIYGLYRVDKLTTSGSRDLQPDSIPPTSPHRTQSASNWPSNSFGADDFWLLCDCPLAFAPCDIHFSSIVADILPFFWGQLLLLPSHSATTGPF